MQIALKRRARERLETLPRDSTSMKHLHRIRFENDLAQPPGPYVRDVVDDWCRTLVAAVDSPRARTVEYVSLSDVEHETRAFDRTLKVQPPPRIVGHSTHAFHAGLLRPVAPVHSTAMVFHRLRDVRVFMLGSLGPVVLDARGRVIREMSTFYSPLLAIYDIDLEAGAAIAEHRQEPCVALFDKFWETNYAHWLLDGMSRLLAAELFGLTDFHAVTTRVRSPWQRRMLAGYGIGEDRHIDLGPDALVAFDELIVSDNVGGNVPHPACKVHGRAVGFLASRPGTTGSAAASAAAMERLPNGVLVIVRTDNRRLDNLDELTDGLLAAGFHVTLLDGSTVPMEMQWEAFASAPIVVAVHGASLANAVFMSPGSLLVELMPPSYGNPEFWMLACARGAGYVCVSDVREIDPELRPQIRSLELTESGLRATIEACVEDRDRRVAEAKAR